MAKSKVVPEDNPNPSGLCMCGCGEKTGIATHTSRSRKVFKGFPYRFLHGHYCHRYKYLPEGMKRCPMCKLILPVNRFGEAPKSRCPYKKTGYCLECRSKRVERFKQENPDYFRELAFKKSYGMTMEDYRLLYSSQAGVCAVCENPETSKDRTGKIRLLAVDHDHRTGVVRGLLCGSCNRAIGLFCDDRARLLRAVEYLARSQSKTAGACDLAGENGHV